MIDFATANRNFADTREKTSFASEMAGLIRLLDNTIASDAAIQKVAVRLDLTEQDYRRQVARTPKPVTGSQENAGGTVGAAGRAIAAAGQECAHALPLRIGG